MVKHMECVIAAFWALSLYSAPPAIDGPPLIDDEKTAHKAACLPHELVSSINRVTSFNNQNDYLQVGGVHFALSSLNGPLSEYLVQHTKPNIDPRAVAITGAAKYDEGEQSEVAKSIWQLLSASHKNDCQRSFNSRIHDTETPLQAKRNAGVNLLGKRKESFEPIGIVDSGTLLTLSFSQPKGLQLIVINIDPFAKHTLPPAFFSNGQFINTMTSDIVTRHNTPVLQPADFLLLTFQPKLYVK